MEIRNNLYSLEGIDGAGKSTQTLLVPDALKRHGVEVRILKSPDNTLLGNFIRQNVRNLEPWLRNELFMLDFEASTRNLQGNQTGNQVFIWDRYIDSMYASNPEMGQKEAFEKASRLPLPRKTFLLDIEPEFIFTERTATLDHHSDPDWLLMKAKRYAELAAAFPDRFVRIDARLPKEEVTQQIVDEILKQPGQNWADIEAGKIPATTEIDPIIWDAYKEGDHVLEVGCGDGRVIDMCRDRNLRVTGIDVNAKAVDKLKKKYEGQPIEVINESITDNQLPDSYYAGAFMQGVSSALSPEQRQEAFQQLARVIAPAGHLHVAEFKVDESSPEKIERYENDAKITQEYGTIISRDDKGQELFRSHNFRPEELAALITSAGFDITSIKELMFRSFHGKLKPGLIYIAQKK